MSSGITREKVRLFVHLAGQKIFKNLEEADKETRELGAKLLLSETLEYVIKGLKVLPEVSGHVISDPESIEYSASDNTPDAKEMLDGLSDVAYTMFWNAIAFNLPLEEAFDRVCDNNLEKFVPLSEEFPHDGPLPKELWHCGQGVTWPKEVTSVEVIQVNGNRYGVGKDRYGKVRKPSTYKSVELEGLINSCQ